jgi:hypothetical protein
MKYLSPNKFYKLLFLVLTASVLFTSCFINGGTEPEPEPEPDLYPPIYKDFYNYPNGRENANGTLEIKNTAGSPVLLFTDWVSPANYIGTAGGGSSIKVKLSEEKFYTIIAVDKDTYEEKLDQASQFSNLTYYSNSQLFSVAVSVNSIFGEGKWIINNNTDYWVSLENVDRSGDIFAVAAPNAKRVTVPIEFKKAYDFIPHFYKEMKQQGRVIALVEIYDERQMDTAWTTEEHPNFNTEIGGPNADIELPPDEDTKPAVFVTNNSDKTIRVHKGLHDQLTNGAPGADFALASGISQLFTGLEEGTNVNEINFEALAWKDRVKVSQDMTMEINKVYRIELKGSGGNYSTTVIEEDAEKYFPKDAED